MTPLTGVLSITTTFRHLRYKNRVLKQNIVNFNKSYLLKARNIDVGDMFNKNPCDISKLIEMPRFLYVNIRRP